jgi:ABC-type transport system involved in multi-copper enzyme maturation permease subunit
VSAVLPARPVPASLPPVRRPSFVQLAAVELRKTVDTRAGRVLLAVTVLLAAVVVVAMLFLTGEDELSFSGWSRDALIPVLVLLPVLGVLAMTSEWTQRTALTTFTLTPRRLPVLMAKLVAAAVLGVIVTLVVQLLALIGLVVRAGVLGADADWSQAGRTFAGSLVATSLALLMGAAIGALVQQSAAALVAYYAAPNAVLIAVAIAFEEQARWVDVQGAFGRLQQFDLAGEAGPTVTSLALWVVIPLVLGLWRSVRRDVS